MKRIHNLDYLRGLAAFGIMVYHYFSSTLGKFESKDIFGRIGVYGVSIFYILSGLTLYLVYKDRMDFSFKDISNFFIKRFFRIFPLMWLSVFLTIIIVLKDIPDSYDLILNLTGLFGFINWDKYFAVGLWSIGNELVFYSFFIPFLFLLINRKILFFVTCLFVFTLYIYFAFDILAYENSADFTIVNMWYYYINPLNQLFLFLSGILIGYLFKEKKENNKLNIVLLFTGILIFVSYPENGNTINLVSEYSRLIFSLACVLICYCFYKVNFNLPEKLHNSLVFLGTISYSLYLLHPIVFHLVRFGTDYISAHFFTIPFYILIILSMLLTIFISYYFFKYFETYFIKLGNKKFLFKK